MPFANNAALSNWFNDPESSQLLWMNYVIDQNKSQSMTFWTTAKKKPAEKSQNVSAIVSKADNFCKCWWNGTFTEVWQQKLGYSSCCNSFEMAPLGLR